MPITEQDIKLLASQRMTDTPDGGGRMTGNVVQSGVDNNIFDDVSNLDRVYGNVSLRKVFVGVLTNDTEKYMGARVVIDQPPEDPNVQCVLFAASSQFDDRTGATLKVESYLSQGVAYMGALYGNHLLGQSIIMLQRTADRGGPGIGDVLVLQAAPSLTELVTQYVRVTAVTVTEASFAKPDGTSYSVILCACSISDPLRYNFPGWEPIEGALVTQNLMENTRNEKKTQLYETVVADASQYYGIRPLTEPAVSGSLSVKCDSVFSPLLPSTQVETPLSDLKPNGDRVVFSAAGAPVVLTLGTAFNSSSGISLGHGVLPGSLTLEHGTELLTDSGGTLMSGGTEVGSIDYANGLLRVLNAAYDYSGTKTITYTPAAAPVRAMSTASWVVTTASRSATLSAIFSVIPAPGTLVVSYRAQGRWYTISDEGSGFLRNRSAAVGSGNLNFVTGSLVVSFSALPDVGSEILASYGVATAESSVAGGSLKAEALLTLANQGIAPNTLTLTWLAGGATQTATDNGQGLLTGGGTGTVDYLGGVVKLRPNLLVSTTTEVSAQYSWGAPVVENFTAPERLPGGRISLNLANPNIMPRTVRVEWNTVYDPADLEIAGQITTTFIPSPWRPRVDPIVTVLDDGSGGFSSRPECAGVVNYAAGVVSLLPETTISLPQPAWVQEPLGTVTNADGSSVVSARTAFNGFTYKTIGATFPLDLDGYVKVSYRTTAAGTTTTQAFLLQPRVDLTAGSRDPIVPGSVMFDLGGVRYIDRQGTLLTNIDPTTGAGTYSGTVNYSSGQATLSVLPLGAANSGSVLALVTQQSSLPVTEVRFRTSTAPLRPGSLQVQFVLADDASALPITVAPDTSGNFVSPYVKGKVNYETGVVSLFFGQDRVALGNETAHWYDPAAIADGKIFVARAVLADTVRYAAVTYSYLPLDASILGLDPVRLPQDGRVPVFKAGRVVLVHNTQSLAPQTVSNGQTVTTGRTLLSKLRVWGNDGIEITVGWSADLDAGTVTFSAVAGYSQPVTVEHRVEDEALCLESQITGDLRLSRTLTHSYPVPGSYVSSSYVMGTLQAAAQDSFGQEAWVGEWADTPSGLPLLASYNDVANPIAVTNAGAITEQWACIFTNSTTFNLVGSQLGQILEGSTGAVLSPVNPATGVPYFTLQPAGWGSGWAAGNVLRFNTTGAARPLWLARTVLQSPAAPPGTDQITISIMGDIDQ